MPSEVVLTEDQLPAEVIDAIRRGRKIEAIKILRESTDLGLANAQVLVDRAWRTHGPKRAIVSFADSRPTLTTMAKLLTALLVVFAAYYFINRP